MPLAVLHWNDSGPPPCHWQCCIGMILGQQEAIDSISFRVSLANSISSALPTSLERWANLKLLVVLLWSNCGQSASHQQYLVMGHPYGIGSIALECFWANRRPLAVSHLG